MPSSNLSSQLDCLILGETFTRLCTEITAYCREKEPSLEKYTYLIEIFMSALCSHTTMGQDLTSLRLCFLIFKMWI